MASARSQSPAEPGTSHVLTLQAYEAELDRDSGLIDKIKNRPGEIAELRANLPPEWTVMTDGTEYHVSTDWLNWALLKLGSHPKDATSLGRDIEFHLDSMRKEAEELGKPAEGLAEKEARAHLNAILQRKEFAGLKGPSQLQLLEDRIARWIGEQIGRILQALHISAEAGNWLAWGFIALAFLGIAYWVFRIVAGRREEMQLPEARAAEPSPSREWVAEAMAAAERGEYRDAVHCSYWAVIARLEEMKLLTRDRARTPRESLQLLRAHPREESSLQEITIRFELIWYGYRLASAADWTGARALLERFGCLTGSTPPTGSS